MKSDFYIADPDNVNLTMRLTMPLKSWREVKDAIAVDNNESGPWKIKQVISEMVSKAHLHIWDSSNEPD